MKRWVPCPGQSAGMSLVELLAALAIAGLLLAAATQWLQLSTRTSRELQAALEVQEQTRAALDLLEGEVRQAGAYGLLSSRNPVEGETLLGQAELPAIATGGRCVPSLAQDLSHPVQWKTWSGGPWPLACAAGPDGRAMPGSTILITRRATAALGTDDAGALWVETTPYSGRLRHGPQDTVTPSSSIATATGLPPTATPLPAQTLLVVNAFYVSRDSTGTRNQPSLRRKQLVGGIAGPRFEDEELVPGIERLAVSAVPSPGGSAGRLVLLAITARSLRLPGLQRHAQRMVLLRNGAATPWP
jgi:prepilin-type N-terminal cleavage/methylation domain-containing protein